MLSIVQKANKNSSNIKNFDMLKVTANHFSFIFIYNIDDCDVAGLLVVIFVEKVLDIQQNAKGHL